MPCGHPPVRPFPPRGRAGSGPWAGSRSCWPTPPARRRDFRPRHVEHGHQLIHGRCREQLTQMCMRKQQCNALRNRQPGREGEVRFPGPTPAKGLFTVVGNELEPRGQVLEVPFNGATAGPEAQRLQILQYLPDGYPARSARIMRSISHCRINVSFERIFISIFPSRADRQQEPHQNGVGLCPSSSRLGGLLALHHHHRRIHIGHGLLGRKHQRSCVIQDRGIDHHLDQLGNLHGTENPLPRLLGKLLKSQPCSRMTSRISATPRRSDMHSLENVLLASVVTVSTAANCSAANTASS